MTFRDDGGKGVRLPTGEIGPVRRRNRECGERERERERRRSYYTLIPPPFTHVRSNPSAQSHELAADQVEATLKKAEHGSAGQRCRALWRRRPAWWSILRQQRESRGTYTLLPLSKARLASRTSK